MVPGAQLVQQRRVLLPKRQHSAQVLRRDLGAAYALFVSHPSYTIKKEEGSDHVNTPNSL